MKSIYLAFIVAATIILTGCASSGSGPASTDYCPESYNSSTALWLGEMANLAYEENKDTVRSELEKQGLTLDEYDIENKKYSVEGFIAYDNEKAVLAFAGTADFKDWKNNAKTWSEPIPSESCGKQMRFHSGFYEAAMEIINGKDGALITRLGELQNQGKEIYITGHSLGGALTAITAYYAETAAAPVKLTGVYTFGQPYTGDDDFQSCYDTQLKDRTFRFVTDKDIVPKTRLDKSYRHVGVFLFFNEDGDLLNSKPADYAGDFTDFVKSNLLNAHSMTNYRDYLEKNKEVYPFSCQ